MQTQPITLPDTSRSRLELRFGPSVTTWIDALDTLTETLATRWDLRPVELLPAGGTSVVLLCESAHHGHAVLKLTPDPEVATQEATALRAWSGSRHMVQLLDTDIDQGAVLLEWLPDATRLSDTTWTLDEVLPLLADLRHQSPDANLPTLADRVEAVFNLADRRAQSLSLPALSRTTARTLAQSGSTGLVHGDLHPGNVLRTGNRFVAIDPRPCLGDQTFDLVDWILTDARDQDTIDRHIAQLAAHIPDVDKPRLAAWCQALAPVIAVAVMRHNPTDPWAHFLLSIA